MLKRFTKPVLGAWAVVLLCHVMSLSAFAQLSPPLNPWLGMMDRNRSPGQLDPYNRNVRPQQDYMKALAAQQSQIQALQQQTTLGDGSGASASARDLMVGGGSPSKAGKSMVLSAPREIPSTQNKPAGFNQYLHYYPPGSLPRRPVPYFSPAGRR